MQIDERIKSNLTKYQIPHRAVTGDIETRVSKCMEMIAIESLRYSTHSDALKNSGIFTS